MSTSKWKRLAAGPAISALLAILTGPPAGAASPPAQINYQGVLRDPATGIPMSGAYDAVFRFFSSDVGGDEITVDTHLAALDQGLSVANGLFSVALGSGALSDGSGPGNYPSLDLLFRDYTSVWMQIEIQGQVLTPRVPVISAPYALNAATLEGMPASTFLDTSPTFQSKSGPVAFDGAGDPSRTAVRVYGGGNRALLATNTNGDGSAMLSNYDMGIHAIGRYTGGSDAAGVFFDSVGRATTLVAPGTSGILAYGDHTGGTFRRGSPSGFDSQADVATAGHGIEAIGSQGGYFGSQVDPYASAWLAGDSTPPGCTGCYAPTWGIWAEGGYSPPALNGGGGFFKDVLHSGYAKVGHEHYGVQGFGNTMGGYFKDTNGSGEAHLAKGDYGLSALGTAAGGSFSHPNLFAFYATVATPTHKITGTGAVSFVQNHPYDPGKVIVYSSLEGDEVGTYTRGTARLVDGEASVALGETFALVTNPDIGLTAHLTPHGEPVALAVTRLTTRELIVAGPRGSDATFDFLVHGLRIGFEEAAVVRPKDREALLPAPGIMDEALAGERPLEAHRALERFSRMDRSVGRPEAASTVSGGAAALREAIAAAGAGRIGARASHEPEMVSAAAGHAAHDIFPIEAGAPVASASSQPTFSAPPAGIPGSAQERSGGRVVVALPASGSVQAFDLVVAEGTPDGTVRAAAHDADPAVMGIALGPREDGRMDVVVAGIAAMRVDASFAPIRTGDLLCASNTPGHARRSADVAPGTVVAKALEPLGSGTGVIRVLVTIR